MKGKRSDPSTGAGGLRVIRGGAPSLLKGSGITFSPEEIDRKAVPVASTMAGNWSDPEADPFERARPLIQRIHADQDASDRSDESSLSFSLAVVRAKYAVEAAERHLRNPRLTRAASIQQRKEELARASDELARIRTQGPQPLPRSRAAASRGLKGGGPGVGVSADGDHERSIHLGAYDNGGVCWMSLVVAGEDTEAQAEALTFFWDATQRRTERDAQAAARKAFSIV